MSAKPSAYPAAWDVGWASAPTSQVARTVAVALLTTLVVLAALFLLWQVRTFVGWFVISLFLAAALNPAVNWLQRRHRLIKRPLAIALTYLGLAVALLVFVLVYQQIESNLLQPLIYSQTVQLNGLMILIALLVGGQLLGIPGALLAIPVAEIIRISTSGREHRASRLRAARWQAPFTPAGSRS